jgi:hypothetical protein
VDVALAAPAAPPRPAWAVIRRVAIVGALAVVLAAAHIPYRPRTLCLFRAVTGVPCPFCGGTTAVCDLGRGDVRSAVATSPVGIAMVMAWPFLGVVALPAWTRRRALRWSVIAVVLAASELIQLFRFHLV